MLTFARVRALAIVLVLLVGAMIAVIIAVSNDSTGGATPQAGCPEGSIPANLELPDVRLVKINVFNGTDQAGLASQVGENFSNRGFEVLERTDHDSKVEEVAVLRYGPAAVGAAHVLQAYFLRDARLEFDLEREDDVVDVVIGSQFQQLATETEVRQAIAALGNPVAPPGTCAG